MTYEDVTPETPNKNIIIKLQILFIIYLIIFTNFI